MLRDRLPTTEKMRPRRPMHNDPLEMVRRNLREDAMILKPLLRRLLARQLRLNTKAILVE